VMVLPVRVLTKICMATLEYVSSQLRKDGSARRTSALERLSARENAAYAAYLNKSSQGMSLQSSVAVGVDGMKSKLERRFIFRLWWAKISID